MTERNVAIFGKSITRSANNSLESSPTTTMADPAIISATPQLPTAATANTSSPRDMGKQPPETPAGCHDNSTSSQQQKTPQSQTMGEMSCGDVVNATPPHSFSTPYGERKPPDVGDHSDSGFRSGEDGSSCDHNGQSQPSSSHNQNVSHLENQMNALQV